MPGTKRSMTPIRKMISPIWLTYGPHLEKRPFSANRLPFYIIKNNTDWWDKSIILLVFIIFTVPGGLLFWSLQSACHWWFAALTGLCLYTGHWKNYNRFVPSVRIVLYNMYQPALLAAKTFPVEKLSREPKPPRWWRSAKIVKGVTGTMTECMIHDYMNMIKPEGSSWWKKSNASVGT